MDTTTVCESREEATSTGSLPDSRLAKQTAFAKAMSVERLNPSLQNPDYLVLTNRRNLLTAWIAKLPKEPLYVLDVGGRVQPYRRLLEGRLAGYFAVDPLPNKLVDVLAVGERLPFLSDSFDLVICTQVLCYSQEPFKMVEEIRRVLKPGGKLFLSSPAIFPKHAENDRWRFFPSGLRVLLREFSELEVAPEGFSMASICRLLAVAVEQYLRERWPRLSSSVFIPLLNRVGRRFDTLSRGDTRFTTNYCVFAQK